MPDEQLQPTAPKDSKQSIRNFVDKIAEKVEDLITLEIRTLVGDFYIDYKDNKGVVRFIENEVKYEEGQPNLPATNDANPNAAQLNGMVSQINLVTGDITTLMSKNFAEKTYKDIREYHMLKENQGHEIIKRNMAVLEKIVSTFIKISDEKGKIEQ